MDKPLKERTHPLVPSAGRLPDTGEAVSAISQKREIKKKKRIAESDERGNGIFIKDEVCDHGVCVGGR